MVIIVSVFSDNTEMIGLIQYTTPLSQLFSGGGFSIASCSQALIS